jgi:hypothetical protein
VNCKLSVVKVTYGVVGIFELSKVWVTCCVVLNCEVSGVMVTYDVVGN